MVADRNQLWHDVQEILILLGYDPKSPHFRDTPRRVAEWLTEFVKNGDDSQVEKLLAVSFPHDTPQSLVLVGPTEYHSVCAHHLLPVQGDAWVGYLPDERICGLSKLSRLVEHYACQLTVQEVVTNQIADALVKYLKPKGAMVVVKANHNCMTFRGIRDRNVSATTSAVRGLMQESDSARSEVLSLLQGYHR